MLRCLGDYPLCSVIEVIMVRSSTVTTNLSAEYAGENLSTGKTNLSKENLSAGKANLSKANLLAVGWIIPPSLRNNGLHCVFIQVRKLFGYFSSRVPFSLHGELSRFTYLKQGNGFFPCVPYASFHNGVTKKRFLKI